MYNFILQILLMSSLGAVIYLIARAIPRVGDDFLGEKNMPKHSRFDNFVHNYLKIEKLDTVLNSYLEKFLRKAKVFIMRVDNIVSGYLDKLKKLNNNIQRNGEKPTIFSEAANKEEGKEENKEEGEKKPERQ